METHLLLGDSLELLQLYPDDHFDAASFSPPYGVAKGEFDIRSDFTSGGRFLPYMEEICRVSRVAAANFTQRVHNGRLYPFQEQLVIALEEVGISVFDRWVVTKPWAMPLRGNRARTNFEFVILFTRHDHREIVAENPTEYRTSIPVAAHGRSSVGDTYSSLGTTPYFPEIPRQVFSMYGRERVLDPFAGTGTSLVEARKLGLSSVGIELDERIWSATWDALALGTESSPVDLPTPG